MSVEAICVDVLITMYKEKIKLILFYREKVNQILSTLRYSPEQEEEVRQYQDAIWMAEKEFSFLKKRLTELVDTPRYRFIQPILYLDTMQ